MKAKLKYDQLLAATLCILLTLGAAEAQPANSYGASFISNPAIYAYTVANQQQQQQHSSNNNNKCNSSSNRAAMATTLADYAACCATDMPY